MMIVLNHRPPAIHVTKFDHFSKRSHSINPPALLAHKHSQPQPPQSSPIPTPSAPCLIASALHPNPTKLLCAKLTWLNPENWADPATKTKRSEGPGFNAPYIVTSTPAGGWPADPSAVKTNTKQEPKKQLARCGAVAESIQC